MSLILASAIALFAAGADPITARTPAPVAATVVDPADGYRAYRKDRAICLRATRAQAADRLGLPMRRTVCHSARYWTANGLGIHER